MPLEEEMSRNLRRLKEKLRSKDCQLCSIPLEGNYVVIRDVDTNQYYAQCVECMTIYNHELGFEHLGIPSIIGVS